MLFQPVDEGQVHIAHHILEHRVEKRHILVQVVKATGKGEEADRNEQVEGNRAHPGSIPDT